MPADRLRVLFLCTGNSCRSQMAEGWARALKPHAIDASSAGTMPAPLNRLAVRAMAEVGIDISGQRSKHVDELRDRAFDVVITVCGGAHEACPTIPGAPRVVHVGFDDPPRLAAGATSDAEALPHYRRVRDEIRRFVELLPDALARFTRYSDGGFAMTTHPHSDRGVRSCCSDDCCTPAHAPSSEADEHAVRSHVRAGYARIAEAGSWSAAQSTEPSVSEPASSCCCGGGGCCGPATFTPEQLAEAIGYSKDELAATPDAANMGLSCGNPTAIAGLRAGEVVVDLGSGGGFDCFVAGPKVGASGRVIGIDMTPEMLTKARSNLGLYRTRSGLDNVEFRLGEIEHLPVADGSVDVVISNCVINLSPDKASVWREIARVLKPGGRVAVSDLALLRPLPDAVRRDVEALVGCVAGAVLVDETRRMAEAAGLVDITLTSKPEYIDAMTNWEDPLYRKIVASLPHGTKPSDFITSLDVSARKGARA